MPKTISKPRRQARPTSPYSFMNAGELAEATKEFDHECADDPSAPLSAKDRQMIAKAKRAGRPKVGQGAKVISVTVERSLLSRLDRFAQDKGLNRAQALAIALKLLLGVTLSPTPKQPSQPFGDDAYR